MLWILNLEERLNMKLKFDKHGILKYEYRKLKIGEVLKSNDEILHTDRSFWYEVSENPLTAIIIGGKIDKTYAYPLRRKIPFK